jgi:amino acid adenylation domain-containing protein
MPSAVDTTRRLSQAERRQLLFDWNRTASDYPRDLCVHQIFEQEAERRPQAVALKFRDRQMTYGELNQRANRVARYLRELGVGPEVLVGTLVERSFEMVIGLLAVLKAGGAFVPLDASYPVERLASMAADTEAAVMLVQGPLAESVREQSWCKTARVRLDENCPEINGQSAGNLDNRNTAENLAYVMYTSGSTGTPKGVMVPHRAVVRLVKNTNYMELSERETFLQFSPISFDASTLELWGPLLNGGCLAIMPPEEQSLAELGAAIQGYGVTSLWLTAGLFNVMVEQRLEDLRPLRQLLVGGDELSPAHVSKALEGLRECRLINGYGPTEGTTFTCCHSIHREDARGTSIPIGRPVANTQVYLLDAENEPVAVGEIGELCIAGDGLARGYWKQPELTAESFFSHSFAGEVGIGVNARIYKSGDLARYRPDGTIEFLGRMDNQVKVRGHRIELGEIEAALLQHANVCSAVVLARQDGPGEKRLVAYVVLRQGSGDASDLRGFLERKLPAYLLPTAFVLLPSLPLSLNGKVDRGALPAPEAGPARRGSGRRSVSAETQMERTIAGIWQRVLGLKQVDVEENFFDIGGDSLQLLDAHAELQRTVNVELSITALFEHSTIRSLARHLTGAEERSGLPATRRKTPEERGRQQRAWTQLKPAQARRSS